MSDTEHQPEPVVERLSETELAGTFDASVWASQFMDRFRGQQIGEASGQVDEGTMLGWFANAIMAGYDMAKRER